MEDRDTDGEGLVGDDDSEGASEGEAEDKPVGGGVEDEIVGEVERGGGERSEGVGAPGDRAEREGAKEEIVEAGEGFDASGGPGPRGEGEVAIVEESKERGLVAEVPVGVDPEPVAQGEIAEEESEGSQPWRGGSGMGFVHRENGRGGGLGVSVGLDLNSPGAGHVSNQAGGSGDHLRAHPQDGGDDDGERDREAERE